MKLNLAGANHNQIKTSQQPNVHDVLPGLYYRSKGQTMQYCSRGSLALSGYQPDELTGNENLFSQLIHPDDHKLFNDRVLAGDGLITQTYRILNRNKKFKWVRDEFIVIRTDNEVFFEGHITEHPETQNYGQAFRQLMAYRDAVDVNIISSITDARGVITYVNKKFCEVSQYTEAELIGKKHSIINSGHHPRKFFIDLWKTLASGRRWHGEILNRAKDGSTYWVDSVIIPVFDERETISHYLSLRTLITGRKESEAQREEYIRTLEEIAFMVAHRIRGPFCRIAGLVNLLKPVTVLSLNDKMAIEYLGHAVDELDAMTTELSTMLFAREIDLRRRDFIDKLEIKTTHTGSA